MGRSCPILVVGLPRSGTTWIGEILRSAPGTRYLFEPDNEKLSPIGWVAKADLHRYPYLAPDDSAAEFERFWRSVLVGRCDRYRMNTLLRLWIRFQDAGLEAATRERCGEAPRASTGENGEAARPLRPKDHRLLARAARLALDESPAADGARAIVKSVHSALCLEWIAERIDVRVVVVLRNPFGLYASYLRLAMPDRDRNVPHQSTIRRDFHHLLPASETRHRRPAIHRETFQIALMYRILGEQIQRNPHWIVVSHDELCMDPEARFGALFQALGLGWGDRPRRRIRQLEGAGSGFTPRRFARQQPRKWMRELTGRQVVALERWIDRLDLGDLLDRYGVTGQHPGSRSRRRSARLGSNAG